MFVIALTVASASYPVAPCSIRPKTSGSRAFRFARSSGSSATLNKKLFWLIFRYFQFPSRAACCAFILYRQNNRRATGSADRVIAGTIGPRLAQLGCKGIRAKIA